MKKNKKDNNEQYRKNARKIKESLICKASFHKKAKFLKKNTIQKNKTKPITIKMGQ